MSWPKRGSGGVPGRCTLGAACVLLMCAIGLLPGFAHADSLNGPHRASPAPLAGSDGFGPERRAQELYLDGVEKLDAGHSDVARQMFEAVIARYPMTGAAELARRQLAEIYSAKFLPVQELPETTASIEPSPAAESPPGAQMIPPRSTAWDQELRRNAPIQSKLRLEAGDRVFFSAGSAELGGRARLALSAQAQWLLRWRELEAAIEGHADEPGSEEENVALSQLRAEAVRQRLMEEGVDGRRLAVVPLGRTLRLATCTDSDCRAQNRRAVTLVFANGTRERLGLIDDVPRPVVLEQESTTLQALPAQSAGVAR